MPRDLESEKATIEGLPPLSKDPDTHTSDSASSPDAEPLPLYRIPTTFLDERFTRMAPLHPYVMLLNQDDLDDCDWLEHTAFDPIEAASREKVCSRLPWCLLHLNFHPSFHSILCFGPRISSSPC